MSASEYDTDTWADLLNAEMLDREDPGPVIAYAPSEDVFHVKFHSGFGAPEGPAMLAWTSTRVYFPVCYDGAEWVGSAPRNPQPHGQSHQGGG